MDKDKIVEMLKEITEGIESEKYDPRSINLSVSTRNESVEVILSFSTKH